MDIDCHLLWGLWDHVDILPQKCDCEALLPIGSERASATSPLICSDLSIGVVHFYEFDPPLKIGDVVFMIGISIYSLGLIGFVIALDNFKNTPVDQPVTSGLYRISRHPQQLAVSLSFMGIAIAIGSWSAFVFMILGVIGAHAKILAEEKACLEQYGESYKNYMERIPRYFLFF